MCDLTHLGSFLVKALTSSVQSPNCRCLVPFERSWHQLTPRHQLVVDGEVCGSVFSPAAWGQVRLARVSQIVLNTSAEAVNSCLLCQKVNIYLIWYIFKRELELLSRTAEGCVAWGMGKGLVIDVLWGQSHSRPSLAVWIAPSAGIRTWSRPDQVCRHGLGSTAFCKPAFLKIAG